MTGGLLTKRALVLAKLQSALGVEAVPTAADDAILAMEPEFTTDVNTLERDFVSNTFSKFDGKIGRIISGFQFTTELKGNGLCQSGNIADSPMLATLFRACGYELSGMDGSGAQNLSEIVSSKDNNPATSVTFAKDGSVTVAAPVLYTLEVVTPGASGTAEVTVSTNGTEDSGSAAAIVTSGTPISLGAKGGEITPTFTGSLALGDKFSVLAFPTGVKAMPKTKHPEVLTIHMYKDGVLHKGTDAVGTFTIDATGGDFGKVTFNFTARYQDTVDAAIPANPAYEDTLPPQIENSLLTFGGNVDMKAEQWSFDAANDIQVRTDVNAPNAYLGSRIADRAPSGGFNPEAQLVADEDFWGDFLASKSKTFVARAGSEPGNQIAIFAPAIQTSEQSYTDRDGLVALDKSMAFKRGATGDDEVTFVFC